MDWSTVKFCHCPILYHTQRNGGGIRSYSQIGFKAVHLDTLHQGLKWSNRTQYGTDLPNVWVVVAGGVVVSVAIGIELLAGKLPSIIACACLISDSAENVVLISDQDILVVIG